MDRGWIDCGWIDQPQPQPQPQPQLQPQPRRLVAGDQCSGPGGGEAAGKWICQKKKEILNVLDFQKKLHLFDFLFGFWGPGGLPLDSQRNFDSPQGLNTSGAFFLTHFSQFLTFSRFFIGPISSFFEKVDPRHPSQANPPCQK